MRLVKITMPEGQTKQVAEIVFAAGITQLTVHREQIHRPAQAPQNCDVIDFNASTPQAGKVVDALLNAPFFNPQEYAVALRQPRAIVASAGLEQVTHPVPVPVVDLLAELWQFSHLTYSLLARVTLAGLLLSYGMLESNLLLIMAGLLFLPLLPLLLSISAGTLNRQAHLVRQGFLAFAVSLTLLVLCGAVTAWFVGPPLKFQQFSSLLTGWLISLLVGLAAGWATVDDAGRRELIGLAATAQIALIPVWLGIALVLGFQPGDLPGTRLLSLALNTGTIILAAGAVYFVACGRVAKIP